MFVHVFGAYFGLAVSFAFGIKEKPKEHHLEGPNYQSDIFAMIGKFYKKFNLILILKFNSEDVFYFFFFFMQVQFFCGSFGLPLIALYCRAMINSEQS